MRATSTFKIRRDAVLQSSLVEIVELPTLEDLVKPEEQPEQIQSEEDEQPDIPTGMSKQDEMEQLLRLMQEELEKAKSNIEQCEQEAKDIIVRAEQQAQTRAQEIEEQARQEGLRRAEAEIEGQLREHGELFQKFMQEIKNTAEVQNERIQQGILSIALEIARKVIDTELNNDNEVFMRLVRNTATILRQDKKRIMRVSVEDYTRYFGVGNEKHIHDMQAMGIEVVRDVLLERGDCVLETGYGNVNTGISKQLKIIEENLREEL